MAFDLEIGTITVFCEASSAPPSSRRDICSVILNRLNDGRWGKTVAAVCLKRFQFSEWNADPIDNANLERAAQTSEADPIMSSCRDSMTDALFGRIEDQTGGATFYHNADMKVFPDWTAKMINLGQRGPFIFYRDK